MNAPGHFDFYTFVLFVHIASAVIAFGATFAYPVIELTLKRVDLRALPGWHEAQNQVGHKLITPGAIVLLASGIYMVSTDRWKGVGGFWFGAAGAIVVVLLGLGHGFFAPNARKRRDQARADLDASAAERGSMSDAYEALSRKVMPIGMLSSLLVLTALLLMVSKPGA
ncbi:MAG TPA: DUF2269 family protein [Conexibacter sp.]|nr:DUF2269 family protein [Conexibacter sp.]